MKIAPMETCKKCGQGYNFRNKIGLENENGLCVDCHPEGGFKKPSSEKILCNIHCPCGQVLTEKQIKQYDENPMCAEYGLCFQCASETELKKVQWGGVRSPGAGKKLGRPASPEGKKVKKSFTLSPSAALMLKELKKDSFYRSESILLETLIKKSYDFYNNK